MPQEIDEVERRIMQLEIERAGAAEGEGPGLARSGSSVIERELAELQEKIAAA